MSTHLSSQRKSKWSRKQSTGKEGEQSSQETGRASFKIPQRARRHWACTQRKHRKHRWERQQDCWGWAPYQHGPRALGFHFSLSCILVLQGGLDHHLLFDTSTTCPVFVSLHSRLKMQVRTSATWIAVSPQLGKAQACQWPEEGEAASWLPRHQWSAPRAGSVEPVGVGGHACEGQPPGVLLLLEKWEVPSRRPKENKPWTVQYTVYCLSDKDRPHCVCSTRGGPNGHESI